MVHGAHAPKLERQVSLDDWLFDGEMDRIARERERESLKLNGSHPQRFCDCPETLLHGKRVPCPPGHNCEYVRLRSALVPQAEKIANRRVTVFGNGDYNGQSARWTKVFCTEMEQLAAPLLNGSNGNGNGSEHERQSALDCEMNGRPVSSGRNASDATATAIPLW